MYLTIAFYYNILHVKNKKSLHLIERNSAGYGSDGDGGVQIFLTFLFSFHLVTALQQVHLVHGHLLLTLPPVPDTSLTITIQSIS